MHTHPSVCSCTAHAEPQLGIQAYNNTGASTTQMVTVAQYWQWSTGISAEAAALPGLTLLF